MVHKYRVSFDLDLGAVAPEPFEGVVDNDEIAANVVSTMLLKQTRLESLAAFRGLQRETGLSQDEKAERQAVLLKKVMLTLMAEANLSVEKLPDNTEIQTELPFERQMAA
jgi:hypothetical protein